MDNDANAKKERKAALVKVQVDISPAQICHLRKKMSTTKIIQEMAESLMVVIVENASLRAKIENIKVIVQNGQHFSRLNSSLPVIKTCDSTPKRQPKWQCLNRKKFLEEVT